MLPKTDRQRVQCKTTYYISLTKPVQGRFERECTANLGDEHEAQRHHGKHPPIWGTIRYPIFGEKRNNQCKRIENKPCDHIIVRFTLNENVKMRHASPKSSALELSE